MKNSLVLLLSLFTVFAFSQNQNFLEKPYLETSATYTTEVVPDRIYLSITISENDTKGKVSVEELENRMIVKLKGLGIDTSEQLSIFDLTSNFKKYLLRKKDVLKNKSYSLLVYDGQTASNVIESLESIKISNVDLLKVEYSKMEELKIELRGKAVEKAKRQANSLLTPIDQSVGKALFISDNNTDIQTRGIRISSVNGLYGSISNQLPIQEPIDFEKIRVVSEVTVYFEIL